VKASAVIGSRACDASKAAVCRNLAVLADRGVAREISGQARFQVWTAAL
jgi:hypothetical protein